MRRLRLASAFTLIELLVVILIIGILIAVAAPSFLGQTDKAHDSAAKQSLTVAYKAARAAAVEGVTQGAYDLGAPGNVAEDMRSALAQSEPQYTVTVGTTSSGPNNIAVDPSSSAGTLYLWVQSGSGKVFQLTAPANGGPTITGGDVFSATQGPGESPINLTVTGGVITDAVRTANSSGDGRSGDSSFGIWDGTTNLVPNGGFETNATGWVAHNGAIARDTARAKFGTASLRVESTGGGDYGVTRSMTLAAATQYTRSFWVYSEVGFDLLVHTTDGANNNASAHTIPANAWTRVTHTFTTSTATALDLRPYVEGGVGAGRKFWIDGVQIEQQPLATPYVETNGATASRASGRVQAPASRLEEGQGWVALRVRPSYAAAGAGNLNHPGLWQWEDAAFSDGMMLGLTSSGVQGTVYFEQWAGGSSSKSVNASYTAGTAITVIASWDASLLRVSFNGAAFETSPRASVTDVAASLFTIGGNSPITGRPLYGEVLWFASGTGALSNANAATIAAYAEPPILSTIPGSATMRWLANDATAFVRSP